MPLLDLIAPRTCASCRARTSAPLCAGCTASIRWITAPVCDRCGAPLAKSAPFCSECAARDLAFDRARAAVLYEGAARDALLAFKLGGERRSASALAGAMLAAAPKPLPRAILFVPSTRRSVRERGFNQAEALARSLAAASGARVIRALRKVHEGDDLAGLGRDARRIALQGSFAVVHTLLRPNEPVLLVDDILTTGATADACARVLKAAGASVVNVVTFARTLHRIADPRASRV